MSGEGAAENVHLDLVMAKLPVCGAWKGPVSCLLCVQGTGDTGSEAGGRDMARLGCRAKAQVSHVKKGRIWGLFTDTCGNPLPAKRVPSQRFPG